MNQRILYTNSEGGLSIIIPAPGVVIETVIATSVPLGTPYQVVDVSQIPSDRSFRGAWERSGSTIVTNMVKAKSIFRDKIRQVRRPLLSQLDIDLVKEYEKPVPHTTSIINKKQILRDAPANPAIDAAETPAELKACWDTTILGTNPFI